MSERTKEKRNKYARVLVIEGGQANMHSGV